jgi:hypothetical protein
MINPYAMKHLLPLMRMQDPGNLFAMLERCAPELRNRLDGFAGESGTVCEDLRIIVDLGSGKDGTEPKVLACTMVKLAADRAMVCLTDVTAQVAQERRLKQAEIWFSSLISDINDFAVASITSGGVIEALNESWTKQTGYACGGVIGQTLADVFPLAAGGGSSGMLSNCGWRRAMAGTWTKCGAAERTARVTGASVCSPPASTAGASLRDTRWCSVMSPDMDTIPTICAAC